jgi:hypothetical protein
VEEQKMKHNLATNIKGPRPAERVKITPERAMALLEHNTWNRPLSQPHVQRLVRQILAGKWKYNGDTLKVATNGDVLDGQHRLWAVVESKTAIDTMIVYDVEPEAFATVDTLRKPRSGADVLSLHGATIHRKTLSAALAWLLRWQRGVVLDYMAPLNRIENSDIEEAYALHPEMIRAAERGAKLRGIVSPALITFVYYVFSSFNSEIADRMMNTLEDPSGVGLSDPFFRLRAHLIGNRTNKDPILVVALAIKAANAAYKGETVPSLAWRRSGRHAEAFPELNIGAPMRLVREGKEVPVRLRPVKQEGKKKR